MLFEVFKKRGDGVQGVFPVDSVERSGEFDLVLGLIGPELCAQTRSGGFFELYDYFVGHITCGLSG
jgi:hypothetical protein